MADEKNLSDDLNDMLGDAKEGAKKAANKAEDLAGEAKEKAKEFANEAKETASEFTEGAKEAFDKASGENKKILAGVLAILLGALGIHKFILGYNKEGIIMLIVTLVIGGFTCGMGVGLMGIVGLIEGIIYLTKSDVEFYNTYQVGKKPWF
ncbi:NINE protein [Algibacter luteus]|jgi:TM2 domain-containing membrane protein YozV|uniref:TM2 domain-containing membrane protein YozV n=1 Tax=Algibacter luteus TaxID=1178825 RepID=A0A1M6DNZ1_9FLAO|nr:NINE protein [Algibacter luteus]WJJ96887.1 NINE protein [Algibacter luteus]SHI74957.1 TM2 domain-containing membrane protein YozV [Algibacter luteus]